MFGLIRTEKINKEKDMDDNSPIYGCSGCATTGGRMACPYHGHHATASERIDFVKTSEPVPFAYHPAIEMIRMFLEKYDTMTANDRDVICKAILELCKAPPIYMMPK